jgi:hypothetical protein
MGHGQQRRRRIIAGCGLLVGLAVGCSAKEDSPVPSPATGGSSGAGGASDSGAVDAGADNTECVGAVEGMSCGQASSTNCGAPCSADPCKVCRVLRCEPTGKWTTVTLPKLPCFDCGADHDCRSGSEYCRETGPSLSRAYECVPAPAACSDQITCPCLEAANAGYTCKESLGHDFTVEGP